jgi:GTP-binding protein
MQPVIALVGRPNVGKSTLFNFLTQSRDALVADYPGLTRDRKYGICTRYAPSSVVIDTGGITHLQNELDVGMQSQTNQAIHEANQVILVVDARQGLTAEDQVIVEELRKNGIHFSVAVNKVDGSDADIACSEFFQLGASAIFAIAAASGRGVESMMRALLGEEPTQEDQSSLQDENNHEEQVTRIAVIGRPNAGKSTLINALLKEDRLVTSAIPGTTRDSVKIPFEFNGHPFVLIDTAGVRRKNKVHETIEKFSIVQTLSAISHAHVVICMIDLTEGLAVQDSSLIDIALREGRALVLAINKTDSATPDDYHELDYTLDTRFRFLAHIEKIRISAVKKIGLKKLMHAVIDANRSASVTVSTPNLNKLLEKALHAHQPPLVKGRRIKFRYIHQGGSHPPTFLLYGSQVVNTPANYLKYLENFFREQLKLVGTPIRFLLRSPENPYADKKNVLTPRQIKKRERLMKFHKR